MGLRLLILGIFVAASAPAEAQPRSEIYKCVDASGKASYTNDARETAGRKCQLVTTQINVAPPQQKQGKQNGFPRESAAERANAKGKQIEILQQELASEQANLAKAKEALNHLQDDHAFLTRGGVFSDDFLESYITLKTEELTRFRMTTHPVEFDMYYAS